MPLLVGLMDTAAVRRSMDGTLTLAQLNGDANDESEVDLEELAAKRTAGGSMLDSIANMANSILGAGSFGCTIIGVDLNVTSTQGLLVGSSIVSCLTLSSLAAPVRSTLRSQSSRLFLRLVPTRCTLCFNRLDNPSYCYQR